MAGANNAHPTRSRFGAMLRSKANENGGLSVSSGICVKNKHRMETAPIGRLM